MALGGEPLRVVSFNVRTARALDGANSWRARRPVVADLLTRLAPHLLGLQEAVRTQRDDIAALLPGFDSAGTGRRGGDRGEHCPLFWDRERLVPEQLGDFWLSEQPHRPGSVGWDAALPRVCTWGVFRDLVTGHRIATANTHLDHRGREARARAAHLIARRLDELAPNTPAIVMGDLNASEDSDVIAAFSAAGFRDTYREMQPNGRDATFHGFTGRTDGQRIDYVLCGPEFQVVSAEVVRPSHAGPLASDHFPVAAELALAARAGSPDAYMVEE